MRTIKTLTEALTLINSGGASTHLTIDFWGSAISVEDAEALAQALQSRKAPTHLTIDFGGNFFNIESAEALAQALQSGKAPAHLTIKFNSNATSAKDKFAAALKTGRCPYGTKIECCSVKIDRLCKQNDLTNEEVRFSVLRLKEKGLPREITIKIMSYLLPGDLADKIFSIANRVMRGLANELVQQRIERKISTGPSLFLRSYASPQLQAQLKESLDNPQSALQANQ